MPRKAPMGKQLRIIGTFELKNGVYTSVASNRRAFEEEHPVQVPIGQISRYYPLDTRSKTVVGNPLNQLSLIAGETYFVPGEKRIILEAKQHQILFVSIADNNSLPQIYLQSLRVFIKRGLIPLGSRPRIGLSPQQR